MERNQSKTRMPDEFSLLLGTVAAATVLDVESTKYAQHDPEAVEFNSWIYGERPSRARMYAVSLPVTLALVAYAGHLKATMPAEGKNAWAWQVPLWGLSLGHGLAAAANFIKFQKRSSR
jgi:hypothetical protein